MEYLQAVRAKYIGTCIPFKGSEAHTDQNSSYVCLEWAIGTHDYIEPRLPTHPVLCAAEYRPHDNLGSLQLRVVSKAFFIYSQPEAQGYPPLHIGRNNVLNIAAHCC